MAHIKAREKSTRLAALLLLWLLSARGAAAAQQTTAPIMTQGRGPAASRPGNGREDWNSLSLEGSDLKPMAPVLGQRAEEDGFTRELLQVQWRDNDPLDLYVIRPQHVEKPPVVLYLYSYPSETHRFLENGYCERVTRGGFAAIGFVSALTGHRYHGRPMKQWFVSELQESLGTSVHDVQMILNYLSTRGDLDVNRVGMFGAGSGGAIAILAAAADPRIKAIDLLDPWGDWPDWMAQSRIIPEAERPRYLEPEFLQKVAGLDPVRWLPQLKTQRIRLQHVGDDTVTPSACKERLESVAPRSAQIVHYADTPALFKASSGGQLFQWIKRQLEPAQKPQLTARPAAKDFRRSVTWAFAPPNKHESPLTCHSERSEESAFPPASKSRFLVATLLGMTERLDDFRGSDNHVEGSQ